MLILWILGAIVFFSASVFFFVYPRRIRDAHWYGTLTEPLYLYLLPPGLMLFSLGSATAAADAMRVELPVSVVGTLGILLVASVFVGFLAFMGVPMPRFLMPKWVYERKVKDRADRRRRRDRKKAEKVQG
ncbi:hypothetical protein [Nesterenkonia jeotgali]|uniref:Heme/copper-type cytochrome/quinol oxidase subunit 3 n=2 Tax=Nesterenkonia jeotgali TaxID=317018 RepID=A0A839FR92_9MICC|nr:hypothetical protein [Nesterenkonia jeotgali]MBA8921915.1 heme/copper-type cytochrome/quinol oxidase subunit 3 [Nesterenkonia jeotgali]